MRRPLTMQARCNPIEPPCLFTDKLRSVSAIDVPTDMLRALSCFLIRECGKQILPNER